MFEKEAEEYLFDRLDPKAIDSVSEFSDKHIEEAIVSSFKDGAEFGYQEGLKAKINATTMSDCPVKDKWQYVSKKGTPKAEGHYLVCLRNKDKDILDCWIHYDKDIGWYSMQIRIKDIYAWKEIVPPELPKRRKQNDV